MSEHVHEPEAEAVTLQAQRAAGPPVATRTVPAFVLSLQRSSGNRAVGRFLARDRKAVLAESSPEAEPIDDKEIQAVINYNKARAKILAAEGAPDAAVKAEAAAAKRAAIVELALSQVGKVDSRSLGRADGRKKGAERLLGYYRAACAYYTPGMGRGQHDYGIVTEGLYAGQMKAGDPKSGPWSWCAIFGMWAIKTVTGIGTFGGVPYGIGPVISFSRFKTPQERAAAVKPGDMIVRREKFQIEGRDPTEKETKNGPVNHHCLVASVDTTDPDHPKVVTVNGNGDYQQIHVRTEPLEWYSGYYDSLSQTSFADYEKEVRRRFKAGVEAREEAGIDAV